MIGKLALTLCIATGAIVASQTVTLADDAPTPPPKAQGSHNFNIDDRIKMVDDLAAAAEKDGKADAATALKNYSVTLKKLKDAQASGDENAIKTAKDEADKAKVAAKDYLPKRGDHKKKSE